MPRGAQEEILELLRSVTKAKSAGDVGKLILSAPGIHLSEEAERSVNILAAMAIARLVVKEERESVPQISTREMEALQHLAAGLSEMEMAEQMKISKHGVVKHLKSLRLKLGTAKGAQTVAEAFRLKLLR